MTFNDWFYRASHRAKYTPDTPVYLAAQEAWKAAHEACVTLYEHEDVQAPVGNSSWGEAYQDGWIDGAQAYREAIQAQGEGK